MKVYLAGTCKIGGSYLQDEFKTLANESLHSKSAFKLDGRCDETSTCRERERERVIQ